MFLYYYVLISVYKTKLVSYIKRNTYGYRSKFKVCIVYTQKIRNNKYNVKMIPFPFLFFNV